MLILPITSGQLKHKFEFCRVIYGNEKFGYCSPVLILNYILDNLALFMKKDAFLISEKRPLVEQLNETLFEKSNKNRCSVGILSVNNIVCGFNDSVRILFHFH